MKPKYLQLLERCIEDGIEGGWIRAHKHNDTPDPDHIKNEIMNRILLEIHEWFDMEEDDLK